MRKYLLLIFLILMGGWSASAQSGANGNITAQGTTCAVSNACISSTILQNQGGATITLSGTFSGTVQFEVSGNGGTTWVALNATPSNSATAATSATGAGVWQANIAAYTNVRVRCSTYSSGTIVVQIVLSTASARSGGGGGGGGSGTVGSCATSDAIAYYTATTTTGCDAGITTNTSGQLSATAGFNAVSDGTHAGLVALLGNTTAPSIPSNSFGFLAPNSASFTSYVFQPNATAPSGTQFITVGTPSSNVSALNYVSSTGSGSVVLATTPTLVTPVIGAATGTSLLLTGEIDGTAPIIVTTGTTGSPGATFNHSYSFNEEATAGTGVTYTLPTAAAGKQYCVANAFNGSAANTGILTVATSATGQFIIFTDGTLSATGGNVTSAGAAADGACFVGVDATHWFMYVQSGTWTKH